MELSGGSKRRGERSGMYREFPYVSSVPLHILFSLQGIPPEHRPWVWMELSGGSRRSSEHMASYYEAMVDMGESSSEFTHQIELVDHPFHPCVVRKELSCRADQAPCLQISW